jgi:predicted dehydrogenase
MEAIAASGAATVAAIADTEPAATTASQSVAPDAIIAGSLDELLDLELDGVVIATPSALHADQAVRVLERGVAVFCQKPLARTAPETRRVVDAARAADRPLGVDLSYRYTAAMQRNRELVQRGALGTVYAVDLTFHNAYGPDKPWFYNPELSGGGCVIDLGVHLVDLAFWTLGFPRVRDVTSELFAGGTRIADATSRVEDFATATLSLESGAVVRLACSWRLHAGRPCVIEVAFYGTDGGAAMRNVHGSFFDFRAERFRETSSETLSDPPDEWGGRAAVAWVRELGGGRGFDASTGEYVRVAEALDAIYGR